MVSVCLAKWCNNRVGNRDLPVIHHQINLSNPYQIDFHTTITTGWHQ
jgi:hypothetical protein